MNRNSRVGNWRVSIRSDLVVTVAAAVIMYALIRFGSLSEKLQSTLGIEHTQLDEFFITITGLCVLFSILLVRRWRLFIAEALANEEVARGLTQERLLLRTVIDHLPDYIFVKDREGRYILTNIAHAKAVKASPDELLGKRAYDVFPPELAAQYRMDDEIIMRSQQPLINVERVTIDESDNRRQVLTTKVPVKDTSGEVIGLVGISHDITHRKREEQQALELAAERERVKMMSVFTRDAAHDFRTPLATINTSLYLLLRSPDPVRRQEHVHNIEQSVARLSRLLDGLTTMTRLESLSELHMQPIHPNILLQSMVARSPQMSGHPNLKVNLQLDTTIPPILGDQEELDDAFQHLFNNAAQYTPDGGTITIETKQVGNEVVITVQDTGPGISLQDVALIFERFYRTDRARASETGGIGLGLSITKKIIELHHGRIEAQSTPGQGSTFRVYLPIHEPEKPATQPIT